MNVEIEKLKASMMPVRGGTFLMGDTQHIYRPLFCSGIGTTTVTLDDFHMASCPVTNILWDTVMGCQSDGEPYVPKTNVSWHEVITFILRLNSITNWNFRLPTESEWEYAARGGEFNHNTLYSGSSILDSVGWYRINSNCIIQAVGLLQSNELGLHDMSGNVKEWCSDIYTPAYPVGPRKGFLSSDREPIKNPKGALSGKKRSVRGGSYLSNEKECWVFYRDKKDSGTRAADLGFRLAY